MVVEFFTPTVRFCDNFFGKLLPLITASQLGTTPNSVTKEKICLNIIWYSYLYIFYFLCFGRLVNSIDNINYKIIHH